MKFDGRRTRQRNKRRNHTPAPTRYEESDINYDSDNNAEGGLRKHEMGRGWRNGVDMHRQIKQLCMRFKFDLSELRMSCSRSNASDGPCGAEGMAGRDWSRHFETKKNWAKVGGGEGTNEELCTDGGLETGRESILGVAVWKKGTKNNHKRIKLWRRTNRERMWRGRGMYRDGMGWGWGVR